MNDKIRIYIVATLLVAFICSLAIAEKQKKTSAETYKEKKLREQKEADIKGWALGCGAVLTEYRQERHDMLLRNYLGRDDIKDIKESLSEWWGVNDRDSLLETLRWLENDGHSKKFEELGKQVDSLDEEQYKKLLEENKDKPDELQKIKIAKKYYKQLGQKSLRGWDLSRYICLCRQGYIAGYITEDEAWRKIIPAARILQSKFDSWEDLGQNYVIGRQFWSYKETQKDGWMIEDAFHRLLDEQSSPWNKYPWNMDLTLPGTAAERNQTRPESPPLLSRIVKFITSRTLVVPDDYKTITAAIDKAKQGDTVFVKAGLYKENIKFKDGIILTGEDAKKVIIRGASADRTITVSNCKSGSISNVTVEHGPREANSPAKAGIVMLASNIDITGCRTRNANGQGILITEGSKSTIEDCNIASSRFNGVYIDGNDTYVKIINCFITDNTYSGIYACTGASIEAQRNICDENHYAGIYIQHAGTKAVLTANRCADNNSYGILFCQGSTGVAENNLCWGNHLDGIMVCSDKTAVTLKGNSCAWNYLYGIRFTEGASGQAEDNLCEKNYRAGILIYLQGTKADILKNTCRLNREEGIYVGKGCGGTVENNICEKNGESGISVIETSGNVLVKGNWCRENRSDGIWLTKISDTLVQNNICSRNNLDGIAFAKTGKAVIQHNTCEKNRFAGILVYDKGTEAVLKENCCTEDNYSGILFEDGAIGKVENNICENNPWSGIAVRGKGTDPTLAQNHCNNNGAWGIISWAGAEPNIAEDNQTIGNWRKGIMRRD